jgi:YcxB-like protein
VQITFVPTISEHLRATRELRRVARVYDALAALPHAFACLLIARIITEAAFRMGPLAIEDLIWMSAPVLFFVGMGIRMRHGMGRPVSFDFGAEEIEVRQPRHRWSVPWARVERVEETPEFFLFATPRVAFYIPRRALESDGAVAALRAVLAARGARVDG